MIKLSIIIPVYNVEKYIEKCITSLINQTIKEIEFIFVNDGTPDNSINIIKKYQKNDKRIKLINKENGGQASARNLGLKYAKGEYIAFLDSDDYVKEEMYEKMYNKAKQNDLDIVICNYFLTYKDKIEEMKNDITNKKEKTILPKEYILLTPSPWNKIIKKSYLEKINFTFPEGIIYEDYASIPTLVLNNPKVLYINECLHYYVQSESSTMRNQEYKKKYEDIFIATKYLYENMINKGYNEELEYIITYHFLYLGSLNFLKYKKYQNINKISNDMKKYFPKWYKNKLVISNFNKSKILYMKLFYYKQHSLIRLYRRININENKG